MDFSSVKEALFKFILGTKDGCVQYLLLPAIKAVGVCRLQKQAPWAHLV